MDVKIYTTPTCGYCHQAKSFLQERGVKYTEFDVSRDRNAAQQMVNLTGQMGVPVITVDDQVIVGFDRQRLQSLLAAAGPKPLKFGLKIGNAPGGGAVIGAVANGGIGARAGLTSGDVVTALNSQPVRSAEEMERFLAKVTAGSIVTFRFSRSGQDRKSEIVAS